MRVGPARPALTLAGFKKPTVAVRFCPLRFKLRPLDGAPAAAAEAADRPPSVLALPYRWIYAVVAHDAVVIYDTQQTDPIAVVADLHFSALTDVAWSADGHALLLTSRDGYCSLMRFEAGELGEPLPPEADAVPFTADAGDPGEGAEAPSEADPVSPAPAPAPAPVPAPAPAPAASTMESPPATAPDVAPDTALAQPDAAPMAVDPSNAGGTVAATDAAPAEAPAAAAGGDGAQDGAGPPPAKARKRITPQLLSSV